MKTYRKINAESGMFIEDVRVKTMPVDEYDYIEEPVEGTFYKPKWNGTSWEEGATQEYIDNLKPQLPEPTGAERLEERVQAVETKTVMLEKTLEVLFGEDNE